MSAINGSSYVNLLLQIRTVSEEAKSPLRNADEIDQYASSVEMRNAASSFPDLTVEQVAKKIDAFSQEPLLLYEAATRAGLNQVGAHFLSKWEAKIKGTTEYAKATEKTVADQYNYLKTNILLPAFSNPAQAEKDLQNSVKHLLAKDIVHIHFHPAQDEIPEHAKSYLYAVNTGPRAHFFMMSVSMEDLEYGSLMVRRYGPLVTNLKLGGGGSEFYTDEVVRTYLGRFPNLKSLDATNCDRLTKHAFSDGHVKLEKIILTGTQVKRDSIDRTKFPQLVDVVQDKPVKTFDLSSLGSRAIDWAEFSKKLESADKILVDANSSYQLREAFAAHSCSTPILRMQAIAAFIANIEKLSPAQPKHLLEFATGMLFNNTKHFTTNNWDTDANQAVWLMVQLWKLAKKKDEDGKPYARRLNLELSLTSEVTKQNRYKDEIVETNSYLSETDIARIRFTLRRVMDSAWKPDFVRVAKRLCERMEESDAQRFSSTATTRDKDVAAREFINEVLVEISHLTVEEIELGQFHDLKDPAKQVHVKHRFTEMHQLGRAMLAGGSLDTKTYPGVGYSLPREQTLAAAFAMRVQDPQSREAMLRNLIKHFDNYTSTSSAYPLPKLILGVLEDKDVPKHDAKSLMKPRVLAYGGIMSEPVSQAFKDEVFSMLLEGRLGGKNVQLVDALCAYSSKPGCTDVQREAILDTLKSMGGVKKGFITGHNYTNPLATGIEKYASDKFFELKNEVKARSRAQSSARVVQVDAVEQFSSATSSTAAPQASPVAQSSATASTSDRRSAETVAKAVSSVAAPAIEEANSECVVCLDRQRKVTIAPCGHLVCCLECFQSLPKKECPLCNGAIQSHIFKVYT